MDAEVLYDTLLLVAGRLDDSRYGPADRVEVRGDGLVTPVGTARGWRRMIYVQQQRKQIPTLLESFDLPQMNPNCVERRDSNVAPQALYLMNNGLIRKLSADFAERVLREAGAEPARQIELVYLIALGRSPEGDERNAALDGLAQLTEQWAQQPAGGAAADQSLAQRMALGTFCHTLMNSAEFIYID